MEPEMMPVGSGEMPPSDLKSSCSGSSAQPEPSVETAQAIATARAPNLRTGLCIVEIIREPPIRTEASPSPTRVCRSADQTDADVCLESQGSYPRRPDRGGRSRAGNRYAR